MTRLTWSNPAERFFETGLDRGVLYPKSRPIGLPIATNYIYNPSAADQDLTWWFSYGADTALEAVLVDGARALHVYKTAATASCGMSTTGLTVRPAGTQITIGAEVKNPSGQPHTSVVFYLRDDTSDDSSVGINVTAGNLSWTVPADNAWHTIFVTCTIEPNRNLQRVYVAKEGTMASNEELYVRNLQLEDGATLHPFFSGDKPADDDYVYEWAGIPYLSPSYQRNRRYNPAVPWNGLTSVDEKAGENSTTYYFEGRPYLNLPKPKEYAATLKAFTYPDAFSAIMGVVEATDGMYMDSQMGDAFDLSYRTLVGDGNTGTEAGYKIHLIYNATVDASGSSYSSVTDTVNPSEFSWEIQSVPVPLEGFRPTSHVIIDTRHMDAATIDQIETLLYGDETTGPLMPSPQVLYDLLNFGSEIIITDNGDGTWTAEGSYRNVYMVGDGVFEIDNVNATDHGDGTFTISSTP